MLIGVSCSPIISTWVSRSNINRELFESPAKLVPNFSKRCLRNRKKVPTGSSQKQAFFIKNLFPRRFWLSAGYLLWCG